MLCHKLPNGGVGIGPDYIRLRNRYEVFNTESESSELMLNMRAMSYLMMLGNTENTQEIIEIKNYPIKPVSWYNTTYIEQAMCIKY